MRSPRIPERFRPRLTFANVVSVIALFVALGGVGYATTAGGIGGQQPPPNSVGDAQIKPLAVGTDELQKKAVTQLKIDDRAIGRTQMQLRAIGGAQMDGGAVGTPQLHDLAVNTPKLADLAVKRGKIDDLAVNTGKIDDLAVTNGKLADLAVNTSKLADLGVKRAKIDDLAVNTGKIDDLAVTTPKLKDGAVTLSKLGPGVIPSIQLGFANRELGAQETLPGPATANVGQLNLDSSNGSTGTGNITVSAPSRLVANASVVLKNITLNDHTGTCRLVLLQPPSTTETVFGPSNTTIPVAGSGAGNVEGTLPLSGGVNLAAGTYNVRVQCFGEVNNAMGFMRGSLTVVVTGT